MSCDDSLPLLQRLQAAHFTGTLSIRFEDGAVATAELHHYLATAEFTKPLIIIEPEDFPLQP
jgi:hypothetical protein